MRVLRDSQSACKGDLLMRQKLLRRLGANSELCQPIFEDLLMRRFNRAKSNAHSRRSHIGHKPEGNECGSAVINPDADLCAVRKGCGRLDKASKHAQIARDRCDLPFRFDLHDFYPSREWAPHRAMLLDLHKLKYEPLPTAFLPICPVHVSFF